VASPKKTLLVEQISYAEEALRHLKEQLHELFKHFEHEHQRVVEELKILEEREEEVDLEDFRRVSQLLQDICTEAMSTRNRLQDLDQDLDKCDVIMATIMAKRNTRLKNR
jgi:thymidylate synthase ThyX